MELNLTYDLIVVLVIIFLNIIGHIFLDRLDVKYSKMFSSHTNRGTSLLECIKNLYLKRKRK